MAEAVRLRDEDDSIVLALLKRHAKETSSPRATDILNNWPAKRGQFWCVMPRSLAEHVLPRVQAIVSTHVIAGM
jgi:glutamate synthase (NADPH/NADH) large chain